MELKDLVLENRSCRRFHQDVAVGMSTLRQLVDLARQSASAANLQPLKYILSADRQKNSRIFEQIGWAAYLEDWPGPAEDERPSAYIVVLGDTRIKPSFGCDHGIAAQTILLGATAIGLGGCMVGSIRTEQLRGALQISNQYEILLVIAIGKPKETVVIDTAGPEGDIKYWRDDESTHHVPKRPLDEIIIG